MKATDIDFERMQADRNVLAMQLQEIDTTLATARKYTKPGRSVSGNGLASHDNTAIISPPAPRKTPRTARTAAAKEPSGRKLTRKQRAEISERMRKYWAARRRAAK